jgi:iron complex outermembrane receptor protein
MTTHFLFTWRRFLFVLFGLLLSGILILSGSPGALAATDAQSPPRVDDDEDALDREAEQKLLRLLGNGKTTASTPGTAPPPPSADKADKKIAAKDAKSARGNETELDREAEQNLQSLLDQHTLVATKTRLNADYVPGMVTVLQARHLEKIGVSTVWEALARVPGLDLTMEPHGTKQVLVRGVNATLGSGNIKFLLNGIPMNATLMGTAYPLLELPIGQVDRIEVIRGPGSVIHGEYAYAGVVNILTRASDNRVYGKMGRFSRYEGGGVYTVQDDNKHNTLTMNLGGWTTEGANVTTGPDTLHGQGMADLSNAPGPTNEKQQFRDAMLHWQFRDFGLRLQYLDEKRGDHFGLTNVLPDPDSGFVANNQSVALEVTQKWAPIPDLDSQWRGGWVQHGFEDEKYTIEPPGFLGIYPEGMRLSPAYQEERFYGGVDFTWTGWEKHTLLMGLSLDEVQVKDAWQAANYHPRTYAPLPTMQRFSGADNWLSTLPDRQLFSLTLEDAYRLSDDLTLTAGARLDHYDDVGTHLTPRLAGVWRIAEKHMLKAQFATAFRPPTFMEMYAMNNPVLGGDERIEPVVSTTYELGYIYHTPERIVRLTGFLTDLDKLILAAGQTYQNAGNVETRGVELEWEESFNERISLTTNLSFADARDMTQNNRVPGTAQWTGNMGITGHATEHLTLYGWLRHVGDRQREANDARRALDGYQTVDIAAEMTEWLGFAGWTLSLGMRNVLDADVRFPAMLTTDSNGNAYPTYPDDYSRSGRYGWLQISHDF